MIKIKINGGLGNQLFQYATGYAFARYHDVELVVDISDAVNYKLHDLRLVHLSCSARFDARKSILDRILFNTKFVKLISKFFYFYCIEKNLLYSNELKSISNNKTLIGYFQNENYFKEVRHELLNQFKPKASYSDYQNDILALMLDSNSLSIHIRRGDYLTDPHANKIHGLCDIDYFNKAIDYLKNEHVISNSTNIFVFSDDIIWCKENVFFQFNTIYVDDDSEKPELDMWLMSNCNNHIISNSTFSWWGAWLNSDTDKVVVAPKQWFANGMANDIQPKSWILL